MADFERRADSHVERLADEVASRKTTIDDAANVLLGAKGRRNSGRRRG